MPADRVNSQSPWHLVLVLDNSGSMQGRKIRLLNQALERMIDEMRHLSGGLRPYFRISIIRFGSVVETICEAANEMDIDVRRVTSMAGEMGGTNATKALDTARDVLRRHPGEAHHFEPFLFFFSDGYPDDKSGALRAGERLKDLDLASGRLRLVTVGLGEVDDQFMRQLATQQDNTPSYRKLADERDILDFFPDIGTLAVSATSDFRPAADKLEEDFMEL